MGHAPENTGASFARGWKDGADAVECDLHLTRDGELVIMHDEALDRTSTGQGLIKDHSWKELRRLDVGSWFAPRFKRERPWRLKDLLAWARGKKAASGRPLGLVLEIKSGKVKYPRIAEAVAAAVDRSGLAARIWVISFDHGVCRRVKRLCPGVKTGLLIHKPLKGLAARVKLTRADGLFPRWDLATPALVRRARALGLFVAVYTVNDAAPLRQVLRAGVDAVTTNVPDRLRALLRP